ncbi:16246_t:CDS:10 [Acaulospora morrowiae]|uniref:16246_t:CDS:1 n=1 Tax=Acaulospora morrowiae TaxID=94023 RepID=A0A9N8V5B6_9GLOM|nr:16246_t:CDS:10 [Acaulospora morrowiae]
MSTRPNMFVIKSLGKLIWGDASTPELIQITDGELYLIRPNSPRGNRECLFHKATAIVRRTGTEWQYQLVIARIENDYEKIFLIDESLEFRKGQFEGLTTFTWKDLTGEADEWLEFMCDINTTAHTANTFEYTVYSCMYERKFHKSHEEATEEEIQKFAYVPRKVESTPSDKTPPTTPRRLRSTASQSSPVSATTTPSQHTDVGPSTPKKLTVTSDFPSSPDSLENIVSVEAELHVFDPATAEFVLKSSDVTAKILKGKRFEYWLVIDDEDHTRIVGQRIEPKMNPVFNSTHRCLIWCYFADSGQVFSFLIRFQNTADEYNFKRKYTTSMYETLNEAKAKEDEQEYLINAYQEDVEMPDADTSDQEETEEEIESSDEEENDDNNKGRNEDYNNTNDINKQLLVGYKHDRSFVLKGNNIGVFKHTDDDRLEFATNINEIKKPGGKKFNPEKGMLHEEDSSIVLLDAQDENNLFKMDLEYGKVVEEWKVHDYIPVTNIFPGSKFAQTTAEKTLVGMSHNSLFRIDPRLSGQKLVDSQLKQYVTKNNFVCGTTDAKGHIAVGSEKGDVKLFDTLGKNAKTNLPALGSGIKGIDVTADGRWIIATTARYLLLLDTEIKSDPDKPLGFEKSFPKDQKPIPRRLQLRPEHLSIMEEPVNFTPARFNTGASAMEKTIVTSTGPFVVTWNFRSVKQGNIYNYQIKRYDDVVVADNFRFGQDRSIVVTLPHDVTLTKKTHLSTPTSAVLSPSKYQRKSPNNITKLRR